MKNELEIPAFLRRDPRTNAVPDVKIKRTKASVAPTRRVEETDPLDLLSPEARTVIQEKIARKTFRVHWLEDPSTIRFIEADMMREILQRDALRQQKAAEFFANRPERPPSQFAGLVPLADILAEMGDVLPGSSASNIRAHAANAIEVAKIVHRKRHFDPGLVAQVKMILEAKFSSVRRKKT